MKRTMLNITAALLLFSSLVSCKKYLEVSAKSDFRYISSVSDCQGLLDDYNTMNNGLPTIQIIGSDEYYATDASLNTVAAASTVDQSLRNYWWEDVSLATDDPLDLTGVTPAYRRIAQANLVLDNLDKLRKDDNKAEVANAEGGALFHRAYNLWFMAQLYTKPYVKSTAGQDLGMPVRLTSDLNEKISRGTVQKTYDQVISDLKKAAELLPDKAVATRGSKAAAYAMLARVYLSMGEFAAAQENASAALAINSNLLDFNKLDILTNTPFTSLNEEVLFHIRAQPNYAAGILTPGTGTNGHAKIPLDLINSYSAQDLRKKIFFKINTGVNARTYRFTGSYEPVTTTPFFFEGIAVDEVYLTRAECYARQGNVSAAMEDLNTLLQTRFVSTSPYVPLMAPNATDALRIILAERKKELLMRGLRWTDLRRLNLDPATAVTLIRDVKGVTYTLSPNDLRYTLLLPANVIAAGNVAQNPR